MSARSAVLIGGAGFIGRPLASALIARGWRVVILDDLSTTPMEPRPNGCELVRGDATSVVDLALSFDVACRISGPDVVFALAAHQGYGPEISPFGRTAVLGAYALFSALARFAPRDGRRVVVASSQSVYRPTIAADEVETPIDPVSVYGLSKFQQEEAILHLARLMKVDACALRYSIVLGPGQSDEGGVDNGIMRNFWRAFEKGERPPIHGDGRQVRDFVHVADVTRANVAAIEDFKAVIGQPVNVPGFSTRVSDVADIFRQATGCLEPETGGGPPRPGGNFCLTSNGRRIERALGWKPEIGVDRQVKDYVEWRREWHPSPEWRS